MIKDRNIALIRQCFTESEQIQTIAQIDLFTDLQLIFGLHHIIEQELQNQRASETPPLYFELGKTHGQIVVHNTAGTDKAGILHGLRKNVSIFCMRRPAAEVLVALP